MEAEADRTQPEPSRCPPHHVADGEEDQHRDDQPEVETGPVEQLGELGRLDDPRRLREARHRVAPQAVEQRVDEQQRDWVEQQGRDDLIDAEPHTQHGRAERPDRTADRAAGDDQRYLDDLG